MPWLIPVATAAYSVYNTAHQASKAKKSENALEESLNNTPKYRPNQSILDYYQTALNKYNTNPSDTREYKATEQGIKQGVVQGLSALRDRRSGLAGVPSLISAQNNSLLKAAVQSEREKAQQFGVLGGATRMKAGEEGKAFQQNELYPFEGKYNLLAMKAAGERATERSSLQNAYNNLSSLGVMNGDGSGEGGYFNGSKWGNRYGEQGGSAYNWAKANHMSFGKYRRTGNLIGKKLSTF